MRRNQIKLLLSYPTGTLQAVFAKNKNFIAIDNSIIFSKRLVISFLTDSYKCGMKESKKCITGCHQHTGDIWSSSWR